MIHTTYSNIPRRTYRTRRNQLRRIGRAANTTTTAIFLHFKSQNGFTASDPHRIGLIQSTKTAIAQRRIELDGPSHWELKVDKESGVRHISNAGKGISRAPTHRSNVGRNKRLHHLMCGFTARCHLAGHRNQLGHIRFEANAAPGIHF